MKKDLSIKKQISVFESKLPIKNSFDVIGRNIKILDKEGYFIFIDGFAKDNIMYYILTRLQLDKREFTSIDDMIKNNIGYIEVESNNNIDKIATSVLSGMIALLIDGEEKVVLIDAREYPTRSISESETEKISRGPKDSFVETIVFNTALIRRRIRSEKLIFNMKTVGKISKTDVAIAYIDDLVDKKVLKEVIEKIDKIDAEALIIGDNYLDELIFKKNWYNPLPQVKYTERPEVVSAHLVEGHIALIIDTSPCVLILPVTLFYFTQYVDDYNKSMLNGTIIRQIRFFAIFLSLMLVPTFLLVAENNTALDNVLHYFKVIDEGSFSLPIQLMILEFGFVLLQLSSLQTPNYLGGTFGILGGLLIGELAINLGMFSEEAVFYMALTAIATYCIPSIEFTSAIRYFRFIILVGTIILGVKGYILTCTLVFLITYNTETLENSRKYLWPLIPFDYKALKNVLIRRDVRTINRENKKEL